MAKRSTSPDRLSTATEDYLRAILTLGGEDGVTTVCALAERLAVSRASASQMVRRLCDLGLVRHDPYREVVLTDAGIMAAEDTVQRFQLLKEYLITVLGYAEADASHEADQIEHALSERLKASIAAQLRSSPRNGTWHVSRVIPG